MMASPLGMRLSLRCGYREDIRRVDGIDFIDQSCLNVREDEGNLETRYAHLCSYIRGHGVILWLCF